ncbi:MAG: DUF1934 domain-containing protein [Paenibacillus sp.]|uniref:Uncharacterized beta-barrel protein YwiB, DUF1934 family n=1 Tax=Paenibacillus aquistagni TaxID=1852522 RepID=A0A1X7LXU9_9BACL|nr:DUF1934 domain-containing protein [Paenibacillus aquistagni]MBR2567620.1 DUF1934 domain-containing protein [Paenibacillus sp.]SMG58685.1 Uncharacterized beta-barrel protein YwiB, DUF1934 family [Paenibacillus aquistagni]
MMGLKPNKLRVRLLLTSIQSHERVEQQLEGDLYLKGSSFYLRYVEPALEEENSQDSPISSKDSSSDHKPIAVMLKLGQDEWKLTRSGAVQSEMSFALHRSLPGRYISKVMAFRLETKTTRMVREDRDWLLPDGQVLRYPAFIAWTYELYVHEQNTGQFQLELSIEPMNGAKEEEHNNE